MTYQRGTLRELPCISSKIPWMLRGRPGGAGGSWREEIAKKRRNGSMKPPFLKEEAGIKVPTSTLNPETPEETEDLHMHWAYEGTGQAVDHRQGQGIMKLWLIFLFFCLIYFFFNFMFLKFLMFLRFLGFLGFGV